MTTIYPIHTQTFLSKGHNLRSEGYPRRDDKPDEGKGAAAEQADNQSEMSKRDTEILTAETHKLESLGVVLRNGSHESVICANNQPLHPHPQDVGGNDSINQEQRGSVLS